MGKEMKRSYLLKKPIAFLFILVSISCLLVLTFLMLKVPDVPQANEAVRFPGAKVPKDDELLGTFGNMMLRMLPQDLAFTVFAPSQTAFEHVLGLRRNESLVGEKMDETIAMVSRVLGFSAVPRTIESVTVPLGEEVSYDSLSGFTLFISKEVDGFLVVNRVKSQRVDLRKGKIVVHLMDGVLMDAAFEQSVQPDDEDESSYHPQIEE